MARRGWRLGRISRDGGGYGSPLHRATTRGGDMMKATDRAYRLGWALAITLLVLAYIQNWGW